MAKAARILIQHWRLGQATASLKTSALDARKAMHAFGRVGEPIGSTCLRCACEHRPAVRCVVQDAAQMYERAPPGEVQATLDTLIAASQERGFVGVIVLPGRALQGRVTYHAIAPLPLESLWNFRAYPQHLVWPSRRLLYPWET